MIFYKKFAGISARIKEVEVKCNMKYMKFNSVTQKTKDCIPESYRRGKPGFQWKYLEKERTNQKKRTILKRGTETQNCHFFLENITIITTNNKRPSQPLLGRSIL